MKTIRILICSPGDVMDERERARQVIDSLRRRYARRFVLKHLLWEDLPLQPDMSFQEGIELLLSRDGGVDIVVFILWSRLGSPVGPAFRKPDGSEYRSGTEREFDLMMQAREQSSEAGNPKPDVLIYRRIDENSFLENLRGHSAHEQQDLIAQKNLVETFFAEEFNEARTGANQRAYHRYERPAIFSQRLRIHLQGLLDPVAEGHPQETLWDIDTQGPPFMGLKTFERRHADVFFGREEEILEARRALRQQARDGRAFLLLCGPSGSGKSSLARAGVVPAILENELDEQVTAWRTVTVTPFELAPDPILAAPGSIPAAPDPISALIGRIAADEVLPELLDDTSVSDFVDVLRRDPEAACKLQFGAAFHRADQRNNGPVRLLLVVDQLEELFASTAISTQDRAVLLSVLEALARNGRVWVLATVRTDFYEQVQKEPSLMRMKAGSGQLDILPPGADAMHRLVEEPAHLAGLRFEKRNGQSLADHILREAAVHPELLPLVEYLLRELYELRTEDNQLTFKAYETLGGSVEGALGLRAEHVFADLPLDAQESLSSVLQALVTLGESANDPPYRNFNSTHPEDEHVVRQQAALSEFADESPARLLVDAFVTQRLFTTGRHPETGVATITVAHESLLRVWPRAVAWAQYNHDFLRTRAHVAHRLKEGSPLLAGDPLLRAAEEHLARNPTGFREELRAFVTASVQAAADAEASRLRRRQVYAAVAGALLAVLLSIVFFSYRRTQDATAEKLVVTAERNLFHRDYARAEIAAAGALTYRDTPETRQLLVDARSGGISLLANSVEEAPRSASTVFSRDGSVMASVVQGSGGGPIVVSVRSTGDPGELGHVELPAAGNLPDSITFSELTGDTRQLAIAWSSKSGTELHAGLWRLKGGKLENRFSELAVEAGQAGRPSPRVESMAFHPSQPWVATSGEDAKLCLWDYSKDRPSLLWEQPHAHGTAIHGIAFNKDGSLLASAGGDGDVRIWRTAEMVANPSVTRKALKPKVLKGHNDSVFAVAFSPDGERIASGGYDRIIRIWDLTSENKKGQSPTVAMLAGHEGTVLTLSFSDDSKLLASGGKDETARVWNVSEGQLLLTVTPDNGEIHSVALPTFEADLHIGGKKGWSRWSLRGSTMATLFRNGGATIGAVAFDPSGQYVAAGGSDGKVRIWDRARSFQLPRVLNAPSPDVDERINGIAFSADGRWMAAAGEAAVVHIWDRKHDWAEVRPAASALRHDGPIWGLCFDPEGRWLASSNTDGDDEKAKNKRIRRWKLEDWSLLDESEILPDPVYSLACTAAGQRLISGDSKARIEIRETEHLGVESYRTNVVQGEKSVWSVAVTDSPLSILSGNSDGRVRRWVPRGNEWTGFNNGTTVETSEEDAKINPTINSISYSKKYGWVAAGGDGPSVEIYDQDLKKIWNLKGYLGTVWFIAFDPEGSHLAYGGTDGTLRVFDVDEIDRILNGYTPEEIYRSSQQRTRLSVVNGKIVSGKTRK